MLKLKKLREDNNLSQNQVCKHFKLIQQTYSNYENETRQIPYDLLIEFANYYDVTLDYLFGQSEQKKSAS